MKSKQITCAILMAVQTLLLTMIVILSSVFIEINSNRIIKTMERSGYIESAVTCAEDTLNNYLPKEKTKEVLDNISVKSQIKEMVLSLDNNTVEQVAEEKKNEIKNQILKVIDSSVDSDTKDSFSDTVSGAYIKSIFPISEFNVLSLANSRYSQKIILSLIVILLISIGIYLFQASGKKTYKWAIIAIYNSIFFSVLLFIVSGMFNNISIGSINTTAFIHDFVKKVQFNIIFEIIILLILAVFSNWRAYFRKGRKTRIK